MSDREKEKERDGMRRQNMSGLPDGCFCDMRGFDCPLHRGREKWRLHQDYQIHVQYNINSQQERDDESEANARTASAESSVKPDTRRDEDMAQLLAMGFDPRRIRKALERFSSLPQASDPAVMH